MTTTSTLNKYETIIGDPDGDEWAYPLLRAGLRRDGFRWSVDLLQIETIRDHNERRATVLAVHDARNREAAYALALGLVR